MSTDARDRDNRVDEVKETVKHAQMGVKVEKVIRSGYREDKELLKVYGKREDRHMSLETNEPETTRRWVKLAELSPMAATEVLFGLAEAHGYELEER